jgi:glycosyltransferase involved in cell wall biosynthesis
MLSVVLAVHNEERNLARCLESVVAVADEIIVVNGGSTDKTAQIAQQFGARVVNTTNKSNFHINKQMAMDAATGTLVLQLDADEVADSELQAFIGQLKQQEASNSLPVQPVAWYLRRKNFFLGRFLRKGGQYPDAVIRLYKSGTARLPQKNVHEQMVVDGTVATAPGHLLHYAFPDFATYMEKFNRYTSFEAERLYTLKTEVTPKFVMTYCIFKPLITFYKIFLRHRGYVDGFSGCMFAVMSSIFHIFTYLKLAEYARKSQ